MIASASIGWDNGSDGSLKVVIGGYKIHRVALRWFRKDNFDLVPNLDLIVWT
jgi:hypothetical protein